MPPKIGEKHTEFVLKAFSTGCANFKGDSLVLPLHKYGYIIPCSFIHRLVPNLHKGVQLIGFAQKVQDFCQYTDYDHSDLP